MKKWRVSPSSLNGSFDIPPSKSHTMRALVFGLLAKGKTVLYNPLFSQDTEAMIKACRQLGAKVGCFADRIEMIGLDGTLDGAEDVIDARNSGLILRLIGAVASLSSKPIVITGDRSIRYNRPIQPLIEALSQLGVSALSLPGNGRAPISIQGPIHSGYTVMQGEDSQPVSALLMAGCFAPGPVEICLLNPGEKPWIHLTLKWLERLGLSYQSRSFDFYRLEGNSSIEGFTYTVPGDFSSAAFPLVAALLTGSEVRLNNLDYTDSQGDKKLVEILKEMGGPIEIEERAIRVRKGGALQAATVDVNDCIDTLPILAVVGCFAEGETHLVGAAIARKKESDRLASVTTELRKMGASIEEKPDGLVIRPSRLKGCVVDSHFDHRIAMALTVAGLVAEGETVITNGECVRKSYPSFFKDMKLQ